MTTEQEPSSLPEEVAVFPLVGVVLLPEQRLPLHIFEPRYRVMVRDALEGSGHLIVCNAHPSPDPEVPRIRPIATVGRIVAHQLLPDGRFNILIVGVARVRLEELPFVAPYRRARVTPLDEGPIAEVPGATRAALLSVMTLVMRAHREKQSRFDFVPRPELPTPRLALSLIDRFVVDAADRQRALEADASDERVALAIELLADVLLREGDPSKQGSA